MENTEQLCVKKTGANWDHPHKLGHIIILSINKKFPDLEIFMSMVSFSLPLV